METFTFKPEERNVQTTFELQIFVGNKDSLCLTEKNSCYIWGENYYGHKITRTKPALLTLPNNERISFIICGDNYTICLTENNLCFVWGYNFYGQLGLGDKTHHSIPTLLSLPNNEKISFIACGAEHAICLTENNLCYVWGRNNFGELGLGDETHHTKPTLLILPNNEKISFITCGDGHTICLTENNLYYAWGMNKYGQLGLGDTTNRTSPTLLTLPNNEKISFITCGSNYTMCLTENNLCYVWGENKYGQLGLGDTDGRTKPNLFSLRNKESIYFITCGYAHTMCLTENNLCYVWGYNEYGQLGLGDTKNRTKPNLFSLPNNERISFITCGSNHTICLTENNLCYVWGKNRSGQLGLCGRNNYFNPTLLTLPNK